MAAAAPQAAAPHPDYARYKKYKFWYDFEIFLRDELIVSNVICYKKFKAKVELENGILVIYACDHFSEMVTLPITNYDFYAFFYIIPTYQKLFG